MWILATITNRGCFAGQEPDGCVVNCERAVGNMSLETVDSSGRGIMSQKTEKMHTESVCHLQRPCIWL